VKQVPEVNEIILELKDVNKSFGGLLAVNKVNLSVNKGELRALIGPNGAGKTTLLNLITGTLRATSGQIFFQRKEITHLHSHQISHRGIARTMQITSLFSGLTVFENIWAAVQSRKKFFNPFIRALKWQDVKEKTESMLELTGFKDKAQLICSEMSYGDQRILEMGIALSTEPDLLLLDEPTAGLNSQESMALVKKMRSMLSGQTIVLVEHDMGVVMELADNISVLHYGAILAEGPPKEIKENEEVKKVYLGSEHA
jgi:branched-chain amino acid transport system ATP-binding protein